MLPRERVISVINHQKPDRVPIYAWVKFNLKNEIAAAFGSVEAFEDQYEFDLAHLFGGPGTYFAHEVRKLREASGGEITPRDAFDLPMADPDDAAAYADIADEVAHHKERRGRFVYVQTPGIFEGLNPVFSIENHLAWLLLHPDDLHAVYRRHVKWITAFANNCLDLGVDMIHVSDDWGSQRGLMFSPRTWRAMIRPHHQAIADAVKRRGAFLSLHSDGDISSIASEIADIGYDVVHPWQESTGMDLRWFMENLSGRLTVMGGLDVQTTIGFGRLDRLQAGIERVLRLFARGGGIYCTSHMIQAHCSMEELRFAFDLIHRLAREVCAAA